MHRIAVLGQERGSDADTRVSPSLSLNKRETHPALRRARRRERDPGRLSALSNDSGNADTHDRGTGS
ncbi:hypothetical protein HETIRDRAFT_450234 [Heterobasidion irregulare TC 32-1]|uniref:Uncharacterized protein n=1 Tax=Heterobasidion irregulare (strain TC 32-1) TaxID=747525 RepID=W4KGE5_HETIT|nr:uncharacterized protein HETIRDRAFT_450234 [Heterobasidion irregulare TC 32-1]ETW84912.1 hypothetical protein HETIRDRAFT_450234 [Heterobasidion irregulare TC 32-1]